MIKSLPPHMQQRLVVIVAAWVVWKSLKATVAIVFSIVGVSALMFFACVVATAIRYKARPLTKRANFIAHMKPLSEQKRIECISDLEKIGNQEGLETLWDSAMQGRTTTILLTGVTGYVGRSVLLQLLRCIATQQEKNKTSKCNIILMVRPAKNGTAQERVEKLRQEAIFDAISESLWDSVISVTETASLSQPNLGCSQTALEQLQDANITHIVHSAADVAFTRPLKDLAASNITSGLQLQAFARSNPSFERMIFISTAFVNPGTGTKDEPLPEALVDMAGYNAEELYLSMLGDQRLARQAMEELGFQNNYVFSKCVAESLLSRDSSTQLCIVRPGIVGPAFVLPRPGWNGSAPSTVTAYSVMMMSRLIRVNRTSSQSFPAVPVDVVAVGVVNALVVPPDQEDRSKSALSCSFKNLVWDSESKIKFIQSDDLMQTTTTFGVFGGHLTSTEAAITFALLDVAKKHPGWAVTLHEIFNKGPLRLAHLLQAGFQQVGVKFAPGLPAAKLLRFVELGSLYEPYIGDSYHFQSSMHIPSSFNVDRYIADQFKAINKFVWELPANKKSTNKTLEGEVLSHEEACKCHELCLAPKGRWDLWWAMTQPNGNVGVRVLCYFASKVFRIVYDDAVLDLETTALALDGLPKIDGSSRLVLLPTFRSLMDTILVLYITFAFPFLGIDVPYVLVNELLKDSVLSLLVRWSNVFSFSPSVARVQCIDSVKPLAVFLEGSPSYDRRPGRPQTAILRSLQKSQTHSQHVLLPMNIDHDQILDNGAAMARLPGGPLRALSLSQVLRYMARVLAGKNRSKLGDLRISFGSAVVLNKTSDVGRVCNCILREQQALSAVSGLQLEVAEKHFGIPNVVLSKAIEHLGGTVLPLRSQTKSPSQQGMTSEEKWCLSMPWIQRFAPLLQETHPDWAAWAMGGLCNAESSTPRQSLTPEVERTLSCLRKIFDTADATASQADNALYKKGITAVSTSHLEREMDAPRHSGSPLLSRPVTTAAASFVIEKRPNAAQRVSMGPVTPVYTNAATFERHTLALDNKLEEALERLLQVDLSASNFELPRPPTTVTSDHSSALKATLLATSLATDQVCEWDSRSSSSKRRSPEFIVYPADEGQCIELTEMAKRNKVCFILAGGECPSIEEDARPMVLVDLRRMNKILWINKEAGLVHVEAGVQGKDLVNELAKHGLDLPLSLESHKKSSLGGAIASLRTRMDHVGSNSILGVRLATCNGILGPSLDNISKSHTSTGCFGGGLGGLAVGSSGSLGIVTSALIRVKLHSTVLKEAQTFAFPDFRSGARFLQEVAKLSPGLHPCSSILVDSTQCLLSRKMRATKADFVQRLNDSYVFSWKGIDQQKMSSCTVLFKGTEAEVALQKQIIFPLASMHNGTRTSTNTDDYLSDWNKDSLEKHAVLWESFKAFVPWSQCGDVCNAVKHDASNVHKARSLPGTPFVSHRIVQLHEQGALVEFDLAICMQGVRDPVLSFGNFVDAAKDACVRHGGNFLTPKAVLEGIKETIDPSNVFCGNGSYQSVTSKDTLKPIGDMEEAVDQDATPDETDYSITDVRQVFDHSVEHIKTFGSSYRMSDSQKLQLYGLYKHVNDGPCPGDQRPSSSHFVARKKYDAWSQVECASEEAMKRYVAVVESISSLSMTEEILASESSTHTEIPRMVHTKLSRVASFISTTSDVEASLTGEAPKGPGDHKPKKLRKSSTSGIETQSSTSSDSESTLKLSMESTSSETDSTSQSDEMLTTPATGGARNDTSKHPTTDDNFPFMPPRWYVFVVLGCLAYIISSYSLWPYATVFYAVTWTASPFADWKIAFMLAKRCLVGQHGDLPLRFNLVGIAFLAWLTFVRFPVETVLWYLDEFFFSDYNRTAINEPLFLLGQPRSGTTKFQDVLSQDTNQFCSMYLYEMRFPYLTVQYAVDFLAKIDRLYLNGEGYKTAERLGLLHVLPETGERKTMRRLRYDLPDEDDTLFLFHGLCHFALTGMFPSASNAKSLYQMSELPAATRRRMMEFHQKAVRKVMYRRGNGRRYLCKWVAGWNGLLEEAKGVYPDAKYVTIVRSPSEQLPSWMKLQGLLSEQIAGHNFMKMPDVRKAVIDINAEWYNTQIKFCKDAPSDSMCIVSFDDFVKDIPHQVSRLYIFLGQKIVPGSSFHQSLIAARRNQVQHKKTVIRSEEQFISAEEIAKDFPCLSQEIKQ